MGHIFRSIRMGFLKKAFKQKDLGATSLYFPVSANAEDNGVIV